MTAGTYLLVVLSAAAHAYWNFLLKRSGGSQEVVGISKVLEGVGFGLLLVTGIAADPAELARHWTWPAVGALLVLANYGLLAAAYRLGDLSLVYPVSRGAMLVFLPPLAFITLGEQLDTLGRLAIVVIIGGIALIQLQSYAMASWRAYGRSVTSPATLYALLAALSAACYSVWDKQAVQLLAPVAYFAGYTVVLGIACGIILARRVPRARLEEAWHGHRSAIVQIAFLNSFSYLLALAALQIGKASYVVALRQLSIVGGALLGRWVLGEVIAGPRITGIALVVAGCILLGMAK